MTDNSVAAFKWDSCFVTGLDEVDDQHRRLVEIINDLGSHIAESANVSHDNMVAVSKALLAYARYHFREEESIMVLMGLDAGYVKEHQKDHARFIRDVKQMSANMSSGRPATLLKFLTNWLIYHILGVDQFMARQIVAIQRGQTSTEAYMNTKPLYEGPVTILLNAMHELYRQLSERNIELSELSRTLENKVKERTQELEDLAMTDALTKLPNRRHALRNIEQEWARSVRNGAPLACLILDADGFKKINDTYGHNAGDEVLRVLSRQLLDSTRTGDNVSRLGGDEFMILCPETPLDGAIGIAERVRNEVAKLNVQAGDGIWYGSISIGIAGRTSDMNNAHDLMKAADESLYLAKKRGRNRVATIQLLKDIQKPDNPDT
jgi:hemerythrin